MTKFKVGDKVTVKEKFWEIESGVCTDNIMKKLAKRTLEVVFVHSNGNVYTKQDTSNDVTSWTWDKNWVEPYNTTITWDNLKWKDVVVDKDGDEHLVLDVRNDLVDISFGKNFNVHFMTYHKKEMPTYSYTIKQPTPTIVEKLELTLDQMVDNFVADVGNLKIKK